MSVLEDLAEQLQAIKGREQESAGNTGWIGALTTGILVMVVTAILAYVAWKRGKELAKIKHEQAVQEESRHQAQVDAQIASHEDDRQAALEVAAEAEKRLEDLESRRRQVEEDHREARKRIDDITSWDDVDRLIERSSSRTD